MKARQTPFGLFQVAPIEELYRFLRDDLVRLATSTPAATVGLSGGSTPLKWFRWLVTEGGLSAETAAALVWSVSDERYLPTADAQSNFGNADRELFKPLGLPPDRKIPWPEPPLPPVDAARAYAAAWTNRFGPHQAYTLCHLGMGTDGHTASLFPGSPLLQNDGGELFAAVDVPGKGPRYTVTPTGLRACQEIRVIVAGADKGPILRRVLREPLGTFPIQVLAQAADRVVWCIDSQAGLEL